LLKQVIIHFYARKVILLLKSDSGSAQDDVSRDGIFMVFERENGASGLFSVDLWQAESSVSRSLILAS